MKTFRQYLDEVIVVNTKSVLREEWALAVRNPIWWTAILALVFFIIISKD